MKKPLIVYVSGAPGSGKTTLARLIAEQLYVLNISSDLMHGGVAFSDPDHDRKQTLFDVFVPTMTELSQKGVSFVVDQVLQKDISEVAIVDKLKPNAIIINIHTVCTNPIERYAQRIKSSDSQNVIQRREQLLERATHHEKNLDKTSQPLELGIPMLLVDTNDGYDPSLSEIVVFIENNYAD